MANIQNNKEKAPQQDDILAQMGTAQQMSYNKPSNWNQLFKKILMISLFFLIQTIILKIICKRVDLSLQKYNISHIAFWVVAALTVALYLVVAMKDPGYVTSYVLREEDEEQDIENSKKGSVKPSSGQEQGTQDQKNKHKAKKSILSMNNSRLSRREYLGTDSKGANGKYSSQPYLTAPYQNYSSVSHLDQSHKLSPKSSNSRLYFSNITTQAHDQNHPNESFNVCLDESSINASSKHSKDKKQIKVVTPISMGSTYRKSTSSDLIHNENSSIDIQDTQSRDGLESTQRVKPLEVIAKKIAQNSQKSMTTSEGDLGGKTTMAYTQHEKQTKSQSPNRNGESSGHSALVISEEEISKRRQHMQQLRLMDDAEIIELDGETSEAPQEGQGHDHFKSQNNQFYAIEEEAEEEGQAEEEKERDHKKKDKEAENNSQSIFYVEQKYCTVCKIEQPLRTKHCRSCNKCVATYDHHCPWIGNCVAEKNRRFFFYFLVSQLIEAVWAFLYLLQTFTDESTREAWVESNLVSLVASAVTAFFILMVGSLVIIHLYLASKNLTTWEFLSWKKISYMKIWPKKYGSPFSQGQTGLQNLVIYFCPLRKKKNYFISWSMPKGLPEINDSEFKHFKSRSRRCLCFRKN